MIVFDSMESLREYVYHALIYIANQLIVETGVTPDQLSWCYMSGRGSKQYDGCTISAIGKPTSYTVIKSLESHHVRFICEQLRTSKGPTAMDFIIRFNEKTYQYNFEVAFSVAPSEEEVELHEECAHVFKETTAMMKTIEAGFPGNNTNYEFEEDET